MRRIAVGDRPGAANEFTGRNGFKRPLSNAPDCFLSAYDIAWKEE